MAISVEFGPVDGHVDAGAETRHVGRPAAQRGIDIDPLVGQQPVDLLDRKLLVRPRANARPCPIVLTASEPGLTTAREALARN